MRAQTSIRVDMVVDQVTWSGYDNEGFGPRIRVFKNTKTDANLLTNPCIKFTNSRNGTGYPNRQIITSIDGTASFFTVVFVTHQERNQGDDDCKASEGGFGHRDDFFETEKTVSINLNHFPSGEFSSQLKDSTQIGGSKVIIYYRIRYLPPNLKVNGPSALQCGDYDLSLSALPANTLTNTSGISYLWQFHIAGDSTGVPNPAYESCWNNYCPDRNFGSPGCYITDLTNCLRGKPSTLMTADWYDLKEVQSANTLTFHPLSDIFAKAGIPLTATRRVYFRVKGIGPQLTGNNSATAFFEFLPSAPVANTTLVTMESCPEGQGTGKIIVNNISSSPPTYKYIVMKGNVDALNCNPTTQQCFISDLFTSGSSNTTRLEINQVPPGVYTIFLLNNDGAQGSCPRKINHCTVAPTPNINLAAFADVDIQCHGENTGRIDLTINGGNPANVNYSLNNVTDGLQRTAATSVAGASVSMVNLTIGSYSLTVSDGCTPQIIRNFEITQPSKIREQEVIVSRATATFLAMVLSRCLQIAHRVRLIAPFLTFTITAFCAMETCMENVKMAMTRTHGAPFLPARTTDSR